MRAIRTITLTLAGALLALSFPIVAASATSTADCTAQIESLRTQVGTAEFANEKDAATLDSKLVAAEQKLAAGKPADAVAKLTDFRTRIEQLAAADKVNADDAQALIVGADQAIGCIEASEPSVAA